MQDAECCYKGKAEKVPAGLKAEPERTVPISGDS